MLTELILKNRSYRRFDGHTPIGSATLHHLVDLARLCPSSRNQQALKFITVNDPVTCERVFPCLGWAGYLKDWDGPDEDERPTGYIIILGDTELGSVFETDTGICAQAMMLGAVEKGFGGCMIGTVRKEEIRNILRISAHLKVLLVLALGKPVEKVVIEPVVDGNIKYWRDDDGVHHVPKRSLGEILANREG